MTKFEKKGRFLSFHTRMLYIRVVSIMVIAVLGISVTGCATTNQLTTPRSILLSGTFAIAPPSLSIIDAYTGKEIDNLKFTEFSYRVQVTTQKLLQQKLVTLIPIEKSNECVKG